MLRLERWTELLAESGCYLPGEAGRAVVIDPNGPRGPLERLEALGWTPKRILLAHEHCDRVTELEVLRDRWPGVQVAATAARSAGLGDIRLNMTRRVKVYFAFRGKPGVSYPPFVCQLADETYEHAREYMWRGHRLHAVALPGHTSGSVRIFLDGDTSFSGNYLILGEEVVLRLLGGNETGYHAVTEPILRGLPPGLRIYPGHGESYILTGKE